MSRHADDIRRVQDLIGDYYYDEHKAAFAVLAEELDEEMHLGLMNHGTLSNTLMAVASGLAEVIVNDSLTIEKAQKMAMRFFSVLCTEIRHRAHEFDESEFETRVYLPDEQKGELLQ